MIEEPRQKVKGKRVENVELRMKNEEFRISKRGFQERVRAKAKGKRVEDVELRMKN